jgi:hypothetical protein
MSELQGAVVRAESGRRYNLVMLILCLLISACGSDANARPSDDAALDSRAPLAVAIAATLETSARAVVNSSDVDGKILRLRGTVNFHEQTAQLDGRTSSGDSGRRLAMIFTTSAAFDRGTLVSEVGPTGQQAMSDNRWHRRRVSHDPRNPVWLLQLADSNKNSFKRIHGSSNEWATGRGVLKGLDDKNGTPLTERLVVSVRDGRVWRIDLEVSEGQIRQLHEELLLTRFGLPVSIEAPSV